MDQDRKDFLLAEYSAILEHSRSHQTSRFSILTLSAAAMGALMLHCFDEEDQAVRIASVFVVNVLLSILVLLDLVFINRLKEYLERSIELEREFKVDGFFTKRIRKLAEYHKGATSTIFQNIFYLLILVSFVYAAIMIYKCRLLIQDLFGGNSHLLCWMFFAVIASFNIYLFFRVRNKLDVRKVLRTIKLPKNNGPGNSRN